MPLLSSFWEWLQTASQGQATFVGTLTGSFFGLVALLLGALDLKTAKALHLDIPDKLLALADEVIE